MWETFYQKSNHARDFYSLRRCRRRHQHQHHSHRPPLHKWRWNAFVHYKCMNCWKAQWTLLLNGGDSRAVSEYICRHSSWLGVITSCFFEQQQHSPTQTSIYFIFIFRAVDFSVWLRMGYWWFCCWLCICCYCCWCYCCCCHFSLYVQHTQRECYHLVCVP